MLNAQLHPVFDSTAMSVSPITIHNTITIILLLIHICFPFTALIWILFYITTPWFTWTHSSSTCWLPDWLNALISGHNRHAQNLCMRVMIWIGQSNVAFSNIQKLHQSKSNAANIVVTRLLNQSVQKSNQTIVLAAVNPMPPWPQSVQVQLLHRTDWLVNNPVE